MNRLPVLLLAVAALLAPLPARSADIVAYHSTGTYGNVGYEATVVPGQGEYLLDIWSRLGTDSQNMVKSRQAAEAALEQRLEAAFLQSVVALPLSSRETVGSRIKSTPAVLPQLKRLVASAVKTRSGLASEMEELRLRYAFPLYGEGGLLTLFAPAGRPSSLDRYLGFVPAAAYTGLVIYVKGKYPAYGRDGAEATLKPCLFPRIYDPDMNLILDATQTDRARMSAWGVVAYSNDLDEVPFLDRVGSSPLRVVARGVYGVADTDIVISREAAELMLSRGENLKLLAEGRILVILEAESAPEPPAATGGGEDAPLEELVPQTATPKKATKAATSSSGE